ncbi:MAG: hypothetical protein IPN57_07930 [Ignavibacteria bacterium]|nr:hypothetical protein [Ignavibacteria bacterium]
MNTTLREKFDLFKIKIEKPGADKNSISLFNDCGKVFNEMESVNGFIKRSRISRKEILRFYVNECTGFTESEIEELLFAGKNRTEVVNLKDSMKEAVKYKLMCELEKNFKTDYVYES